MLLHSISWLTVPSVKGVWWHRSIYCRRMFPLPLHPVRTLIWFITWCLLLGLRSEQLHLASSNSVGKESACNAGDPGLIPRSARYPGERNGNPLQYSCLENPTDRRSWQAVPRGHKESDTTEWLILSFYLLFLCQTLYVIVLSGFFQWV